MSSRLLCSHTRTLSTQCPLWTLIALLLLCAASVAQVQTGTITGTVRDKTGAVIPNAHVTIKNLDTGATRDTVSNGQGGYTVPGLPPGNYELNVAAGSFSNFKQTTAVTVGGIATVDATLGLAEASTTVEVTAQQEAVQVNTQTQEVSQIITPTEVAQLPSLTRNPYDFVAVAGNVSGGDRAQSSSNPQLVGSGQNNTDRGVGYSINGQRASGTEILLDGVENTNIFDTTIALWIPQDAVQEFRVVTNNFEPQYGRAAGGVINLTSKSGSNSFHGSAWEFNRLSDYTANTYDNAVQGIPKGKYARNQFGYTIGGPVVKDKLFFFQSTEWLRVRSDATLLGYVPTPQLLALTDPSVQAYFSKFGSPAPSFTSTVPASALQPAGGAFDTIPGSTPAFGLAQYKAPADAGGDLPQNTYTLDGRVDFNPTDKTQMFFRFGRESLDAFLGTAFASPYPQYNVGTTIYNNSFLYSLSHTFGANLLSNTRLSFFRDDVAEPYNTALTNTPTLFLYNAATLNGQPINMPGFFDAFTGTGGLPFGGPQNSAQVNEDLAYTHGNHTMRFGGQVNYIQLNRAFGAYAQGNEQLGANINQGLNNLITGTLTNFQVAVDPHGAFPCPADPTHPSSIDPSHLITTPQCLVSLPTTSPSFSRSDRYRDWAIYAQDSWKVTPRFTFNYGVRYEHYGVQHNSNPNLDSNFYYGPGATYFDQVRNGSVQIAPRSSVGGLWNPRWGTVGPRIGFAWDLFGNASTAPAWWMGHELRTQLRQRDLQRDSEPARVCHSANPQPAGSPKRQPGALRRIRWHRASEPNQPAQRRSEHQRCANPVLQPHHGTPPWHRCSVRTRVQRRAWRSPVRHQEHQRTWWRAGVPGRSAHHISHMRRLLWHWDSHGSLLYSSQSAVDFHQQPRNPGLLALQRPEPPLPDPEHPQHWFDHRDQLHLGPLRGQPELHLLRKQWWLQRRR
jgi:outer membrane receptor protein involved in Fe transport